MEGGRDTGATAWATKEIASNVDEIQAGATPSPSKDITWLERQIQRRYGKHAADPGVVGPYTPQTAEQFKQALKDFVDQPDILKVQGTYQGQPVTRYTGPSYGKVVMVSPGGEFISGWTLNTDQSDNLKQRHSL